MSDISDSLREQARHLRDDGRHMSLDSDQVECIADRIDAEMAELPRDRDGVPIRVDDTVYGEDGRAWHVRGVTIGEMSEDSRYTIRVTGDTGEWRHYKPEWLTHERPDSWSRIADELDEWCDRTGVDGDACGELRALASRLRRLAEREDER